VTDIYRDIELSNQKLFNDEKSYAKYFKNKFASLLTIVAIDRIKCLLSLSLAKGLLFSKLVLHRIELQKKMLIINIESS
jgi:hypothetical protein